MTRNTLTLLILLIVASSSLRGNEKYALLIGIDKYQSERIQGLKYSQADASYLQDILVRYARYKPQNVHILLGSQATAKAIKSEVFWLGKTANPEDDVFFYFSGHGTRVKDEEGDEDDGMDEAFCPVETDLDDPSTVILDDEFGYWFDRVKSSQVMVLLDCCHSGGAAGRGVEEDGSKGLEMAAGTLSRSMALSNKDLYAKDLSGNNKFIMTASDAVEQSYENPKLGHGVFTYYAGEAIEGMADANFDKNVDINELYQYTKNKTLEFAKSINKTQSPSRFGSLNKVVVSQINKQLCNIQSFDASSKTIRLEIDSSLTRPGDVFIIRKRPEQYSKDLEIVDQSFVLVQINNKYPKYCEGTVSEEYIPNFQGSMQNLNRFYAEKICFGSLFVITEPWSTVLLDGKELGSTPVSLMKVPEGKHALEFQIAVEGYPPSIKREIVIQEDQKMRIVEKFPKVQ